MTGDRIENIKNRVRKRKFFVIRVLEILLIVILVILSIILFLILR